MTHIAHNWVPAPPDELVTDRGAPLSSGNGAATAKSNSRQVFSSGLSRAIELAIALRHLGANSDSCLSTHPKGKADDFTAGAKGLSLAER